MRRTKTKTRTSPRPTPRRRSAEPYLALSKQAEELMELAVEAAQSRHLPDFLEQFALRSTRMLDAVWGGVAVYRGRETELHAMPGGSGSLGEAGVDWLASRARESQKDVESRTIPKEIAAGWSPAEEPEAAVFVRVAASDNERLGTLCLFRRRKTLGADEDSHNWSGPSASGWKISMQSAITSWCTIARGISCERTARWRHILAFHRWRWSERP